jgi:hypothetical protein
VSKAKAWAEMFNLMSYSINGDAIRFVVRAGDAKLEIHTSDGECAAILETDEVLELRNWLTEIFDE